MERVLPAVGACRPARREERIEGEGGHALDGLDRPAAGPTRMPQRRRRRWGELFRNVHTPELPSWRSDSAQLSLHLVAAGGDDLPPPTALASARHLGQPGWPLARAGVSSGAWLLARASPACPAQAKTFTLVVNGKGEVGETVPKSLRITISTQEQFDSLIKRHGGGSLVLDDGPLALDGDASVAVEVVSDITPGGTYSLIGGQQEAFKRHLTWTQVADKELELRATEAVRDASEGMLGKLQMSTNTTLCNARGEKREFDGLLINTETAIAIEAKHCAVPEHVTTVLKKAAFLLDCARESAAGGSLAGITGVLPVLASSRFGPAMLALCEARGVSVVKPNGSGHTFVPFPPPLSLAGRRGLHTLARVLRVLL